MKPLQKSLPGFACVLPGLAFQLLIITAGLFAAAPGAAVTLAVCEEPATDADAGYYLGQHKRVRLWQGEGDAPADSCVALELPLPASAIRWLGLASSAAQVAPDSLVLQGNFTDSVRVSEVQLAAEPPPASPLLPVEVDVLPQFSISIFGVEERVQATADGGWRCSAGSQPAGLVLSTSAQWEGAYNQELELQIEGDGALQLAVADAVREQGQAPLVLGTLPLQAEQGARVFRYRLPVQPQAWTSVTLLCPATAAEFTLQQLRLLPQALPAMRQRAAWFWAPALWQHDAERLFALAQA